MKKTLLAAALSLGLTGGNSAMAAGGIQIDPTGTGNIGASTFLTSLGSSLGNFLADNALASAGANTTAGGTTIWAHNSIPILGGELSIIFSIPMTAALTGAPGTMGTVLVMSQDAPGTFQMWFDSSADANQTSGLGYADGVLIASGDVSVVPPLSFSNLSGGNAGLMSGANAGATGLVDSISGNGSATIDVDITFVDPLYVVNNISAAPVDLQLDNALRLLYTNGSGNRASTAFANGAVIPYFGTNGDNNFSCGGLEVCDFQAQMNTTFLFFAPPVPEPGTVALMGAALGLFGGLRARRKKSA